MTLKVYRRLWCDGRKQEGPCGSWHGAADFPDQTPACIRRSARLDGWARCRRDSRLVDLCPECRNPPAPDC